MLGLDVLPEKVEALAAGTVPFFEPGLPELLRKNLDSGRLRFTTSFEEVGEFGDVHFVCVGTPQKAGELVGRHDLRRRRVHLPAPARQGRVAAGRQVAPSRPAPPSGSPSRSTTARGDELELAWNPEFLREGFAVEDTLTPDRLVFGVRSDAGRGAAAGPPSSR